MAGENRAGSRRGILVCVAAACLMAASSLAVMSSAAGGQESDGGVVVRIAARKAADGRVEFGLQQRQGDASWGERMLPPRRFFPTTATVGRWRASSPLAARPPQAAAQSTQATGRDVLMGLLAALGTATENPAGYDRSDYDHSSGELCDTAGTCTRYSVRPGSNVSSMPWMVQVESVSRRPIRWRGRRGALSRLLVASAHSPVW